MKYVIGDIHGCATTLKTLLKKLHLKANDELFFVGDYIDRGPDSKGVLDILMNLKNARFLMGNHEDMMLKALETGDNNLWFSNGGTHTKKSFAGVKDMSPYIDFMGRLEMLIELDNFYIAHGGVNPWQLKKSTDYELLWDRKCCAPYDGKKLIVGHSMMDIVDIYRMAKGSKKITIDNGCVWGQSLVALRLDNLKVISVRNCEPKIVEEKEECIPNYGSSFSLNHEIVDWGKCFLSELEGGMVC